LWDYEFGWVGSMHDWIVFQLTKVGEMCIQVKFLPCKLIGDVAYLVRTWIYCSFKGAGDLALEEYKANWNFIQSSTQMFVEQTFDILKWRWKIIMKHMDCSLCFILDVIVKM
jgi:hypothetical protein